MREAAHNAKLSLGTGSAELQDSLDLEKELEFLDPT